MLAEADKFEKRRKEGTKMKKIKTFLALILSLCLIMGMTTPAFAKTDEETTEMQTLVETLGKYVDGEEIFDYLSYVYLGWRTTGGSWQNQVIDTFVVDQLKAAGYAFTGGKSVALGTKGSNDMSGQHDKDYSWVTYYDVDTLTWDPEYAKLSITTNANFDGVDKLIDRVNVESYGFNPTTDIYKEHYGVDSIDDMWKWITEKDAGGNRVNVLNGKEAELNKRCHLAWNSCFTEPGGTKPADAVGVTGEVVYVGAVSGKSGSYTCTKYPTVDEANANLSGKVILTDSSLRNAFSLAQQTGAIAVMSTASLNNYSTPRDENGNILEPFVYSVRYASGAALKTTAAQTDTGKPIVEWQFSNDQKAALLELLEKADGTPVYATNISIGRTYAMNDATHGGKGQAVTMAEIKGASKPDERVILCAHVQEPGSNDNATGVASLLGLATTLKKMVDSGAIARPERTITFLWGDEMNLATLWLNSHPDEKTKALSVLNMDMVGEDPDKTGGVMRIEKTPDPSAKYNYTLDTLPWETDSYYDETFADPDGQFIRLPDSHTLWGAGSYEGMFQEGFFLNDLYMYAAQGVINYHDSDFRVDVCPYEGGSDHSRFLAQNVPALLTWHFTDYTYHSSVDTLNMSSAREMENVSITTMATALMIANATDGNEALALEILGTVMMAALDRFDMEQANTENHRIYTLAHGKDFAAALDNEKEVLQAWADWYKEALASPAEYLLDAPSQIFRDTQAELLDLLEQRLALALACADEYLQDEVTHTGLVKIDAAAPTFSEPGNIEFWYCQNCGKLFADPQATRELTDDDVLIPFVNPTAKTNEGGKVTFNQDMTEATITPDSGYAIKDVLLNGKSVGKVAKLDKLASGDTIQVVFEKLPASNPATGDTMPIVALFALLAVSGAGVLLLRRRVTQ